MANPFDQFDAQSPNPFDRFDSAQPAQSIQPSISESIGRQAGRTGRMILEGVGDVAGIVGNPIAAMTGLRRPADIASDLATRAGLPENVSDTEKLTGSIGRGIVSAGAMVGGGSLVSKLPGIPSQVGKFFAAQPVAQITSGGAGAGSAELARQGGAGETGQLVAGVAGSLTPTAIPYIGRKLAAIPREIAGVTTGVGGAPLSEAYQAGKAGGSKAQAFRANIEGNAPVNDALITAKNALENMRQSRSAQYKATIGKSFDIDKPLDFTPIETALEKTLSTVKGKGSSVLQEITPETNIWVDKFGQRVDVPETLKAPNVRNVLDELKKSGGINISEMSDMGLTAKDMKRYPGLFTKNGKKMDAVTEHLQQKGWMGQHELDAADSSAVGGSHELSRDMVSTALENPKYIIHPEDADAAFSYQAAEKAMQDAGINKVTIPAKTRQTSGEYWTIGKDEQAKISEVADIIKEWKLDPARHNVEGLDALKRRIGAVYPENPKQAQAQRLIDTMYNSVKGTIEKQAPGYSSTMRDYSSMTDQIREIEKSLSIGNKATADTAMRKLQSLMRNNVSTNYGGRIESAKQLEKFGAGDLMPSLAGQSLSEIAPRGLARIGGGLAAGGAFVNPSTLAALPITSPRLMGEAAYYTGKLSNLARPLSPLAYDELTKGVGLRSLISGGMGANQ